MTKKTLPILIIATAMLLNPCISVAKSDYEFYFFGVNLKAFKDSNWMMVAAGAATSVLAHELGHILYLKSQGRDWRLESSPSGLAVHTNNHLSNKQHRKFGLWGFAFQAGIGAALTTFESTKHLDFTKGWVGMNVVELWTYKHRKHDNGDDFESIERGNGDSELYFGGLSAITQYGLLKLKDPDPSIFIKMSDSETLIQSKLE